MAAPVKVWLNWFPQRTDTPLIARRAEDAGFEGLLLTDSPALAPDLMLDAARAGAATSRLAVGACATNLVTHHPGALGAAAATLADQLGTRPDGSGRVVLGVARGDSGVSKFGLHPTPLAGFPDRLAELRSFVRGEGGFSWLPPNDRVQVWAVGSGLRVLRASAPVADACIAQVGADPAILAQVSAEVSGRLVPYVIVGLDTGPGTGAAQIAAVTNLLGRMPARLLAELGSDLAPAARRLADGYQLATHGVADGPAGSQFEEFLHRYAVIGDADTCTERLQQILDLGFDELVVILGSFPTPTAELLDAMAVFGKRVVPRLRAGTLH